MAPRVASELARCCFHVGAGSRSRISEPPDPRHRSISRRWGSRCAAAHRGREARGALGAARRRGKSGRGFRKHRHGGRGARRARRPHAARDAPCPAGDQSQPVPKAPLRPRSVRAGDGDGGDPERAARQRGKGPGQHAPGVRRARAREPGQVQLCFPGDDHRFISHDRDVQDRGRGPENHACTLQRDGARARRAARWRSGNDVRQSRGDGAARSCGQAQGARGRQRAARTFASGDTGDGGVLSGIRLDRVVQRFGPTEDARGHRRQALRRDRGNPERARRSEALL